MKYIAHNSATLLDQINDAISKSFKKSADYDTN